jgi:hypothetical protein
MRAVWTDLGRVGTSSTSVRESAQAVVGNEKATGAGPSRIPATNISDPLEHLPSHREMHV